MLARQRVILQPCCIQTCLSFSKQGLERKQLPLFCSHADLTANLRTSAELCNSVSSALHRSLLINCRNLQVRPDTPRPSLPEHPTTLSDDSPLAPAQLEYAPSPEPDQAISAPSLVAQPSAHAHTSETAVQAQQADSSSLECHLQEEHAHLTDGSSGPDLDIAHSNFTTVAADQADREEEAGDVEEEECEEQDSAHLTIMADAAADQAAEEGQDGAAEEEEYEQQSEPAQDPASCDADEDDSGGSSSEYEEDDQEGKAVTMSSSASSSGTEPVPSSSATTSSDGPAVPTPAVDAAGDHITGGLSAAIRPSPADADSTNVSTDGPPAVPSSERVGDEVVSLTAAAQHHESSFTADSRDAPIPSSSAQNEVTSIPPAGAANLSTPPVNEGDEEDEEHPVYDSLSEEEEETGEEVSSSEEEDAAEEEAAEASEYEEDEREVSESEEEDDVASDQDEEAVAALHRKIRELQAQDSR